MPAPITQKFYASGKGNGLPFCPEKKNVSSFTYWMTLGGTQKGNVPTPAEIQLSLVNAWLLYWNLYKVNATFFDVSSTGTEFHIDFEDEANNEHSWFSTFTAYKEDMSYPKNRLCTVSLFLNDDPDSFDYEYADFEIGVAYSKYPIRHGLSSNFYGDINVNGPVPPSRKNGTPIVRMYDGLTSDETKFVGYGINSDWTDMVENPDSFIFERVGSGINGSYIGGPPDAWVSLLSYATPGKNGDDTDNVIGYGNIPIAVNRVNTGASIPVVVCTYTLGDGAPIQAVVDTETRTSKYVNSADPDYAEGIQIDSIEFYDTFT